MSLFNSKVGPDVLPIHPELDIHSALSAGIKFIHEGRSHDSGSILKDKHSPVTGGLAWQYSQGRNVLRRATKSHTCSILQAHFIGFTSSEARCGHPAVPVNSRVSLSNPDLKQGTTATYTCDEGYELFGPVFLSTPSYVRMHTTVKHHVTGTVKHTVPYKDVCIFVINWGMATEELTLI
uniref:(California timema) hypothetical protein n=1 Tax=Timema californicum TaxID=61474 RepID=A0A7R9IYV5_TIMCA|nr:unnamed protein product [Timema californicum]